MAATAINRDWSSAGNRLKWTYSAWIKRSGLGGDHNFFSAYVDAQNFCEIKFQGADQIQFQNKTSNSWTAELKTNRVFRDTNAWYHIVAVWDTANATSGNRLRLYVNGVEETSFGTETQPAQDYASGQIQVGNNHFIGKLGSASGYFDGIISHVHFCDGYAYAASDFGETDATTGEWKIKTSPSVSYGTKGFWILKDGTSLTDQSPNSNNWGANTGTLTKTEDCPSNVFATFNALIPYNGTFSNGMTTYQAPSSNPVFGSLSTLGMSSGKFYAECKYSAGSNHYLILGIADNNFDACASTPDDLGKSGTTESIGYVVNTGAYRVNNNNTSWGSAGGDGDILQIAVDRTNEKIWFGVNGTWGASGNPATGSNGIDVSSVLTGDTWFFGVSNDTGASETIAQFNFGNGYFGTSAISSEGTNASGIGIFEYDVPTGFTALSTKGLNE